MWRDEAVTGAPIVNPLTNCGDELLPYVACPPKRRRSRSLRQQAAVDPSCADKDIVLGEPPAAITARLSSVFCDGGAATASVGSKFTAAVLASLDANRDGTVSCAEWPIAKARATLASVGGAYLGPPALPPPACKMTQAGAARWASHNAYLAELAAATAKTNATALVAAAKGGVRGKVGARLGAANATAVG